MFSPMGVWEAINFSISNHCNNIKVNCSFLIKSQVLSPAITFLSILMSILHLCILILNYLKTYVFHFHKTLNLPFLRPLLLMLGEYFFLKFPLILTLSNFSIVPPHASVLSFAGKDERFHFYFTELL